MSLLNKGIQRRVETAREEVNPYVNQTEFKRNITKLTLQKLLKSWGGLIFGSLEMKRVLNSLTG